MSSIAKHIEEATRVADSQEDPLRAGFTITGELKYGRVLQVDVGILHALVGLAQLEYKRQAEAPPATGKEMLETLVARTLAVSPPEPTETIHPAALDPAADWKFAEHDLHILVTALESVRSEAGKDTESNSWNNPALGYLADAWENMRGRFVT